MPEARNRGRASPRAAARRKVDGSTSPSPFPEERKWPKSKSWCCRVTTPRRDTVAAAMEVMRALKVGYRFRRVSAWRGVGARRDRQGGAGRDRPSDSTLFGSTNGRTNAIVYLRWGKQTYANLRPCRYMKGFRSPLAHPDGIDYVIVRENLEDLYLGLEGPLEAARAAASAQPHPARGTGYLGARHVRDQGDHRAQHAPDRAFRLQARAPAQEGGPSRQGHLHVEVQHAARERRPLPADRRRSRRRLSGSQVRAVYRRRLRPPDRAEFA